MDRATEAAASDLAEVRKLIESMNALVSSQQQQQQQQQQLLQKQKELQQQQQQPQQSPPPPPQQSPPPQEQQQQQQEEEERNLKEESKEAPLVHNQQLHQQSLHHQQQQPQETQLNPSLMPQGTTQNWPANTNTQYAAPTFSHQNHVNTTTTTTHDAKAQNTSVPPMAQALPTAGVIVEVSHITYTEATIEPLIAWLRLTFQDPTISGMVLQYKGFDGLWKCLLNRDDSLKRVLKQNLKNNTILQMRVPCEQDLLSSGYTDKRLLALTTKPIAPSIEQANATGQMMEDNNANNNSHNSNSDNNNNNNDSL
ncbi:hypothetical protein CU097_013127 [Rhizopus azygosporus]|uniref:Uncharacterized protein n=1 Tax=Rhizopus azygosporus TaxID=86630 RepID=A0A367JX26_RHIAZ|nr:hypothetical protein CU097_013127 [Rhizopus azygosporus]